MRLLAVAALAVAAGVGGFGCSGSDGSEAAEPARVTLPGVAPAPNEDADDEDGYFAVHADTRTCPAPICGGVWVSRVNRERTLCPNGQAQSRCYVADVSFASLGLTAATEADLRSSVGRLLVRGRMTPIALAEGTFGLLNASEVWRAESSRELRGGTFFLVTAEACENLPCPSMTAKKLNSTHYPQRVVGFDVGEDDAQTKVLERVSAQGLVVAGSDFPRREGVSLGVNETFARVTKAPVTSAHD